jgi:hypothetical protein
MAAFAGSMIGLAPLKFAGVLMGFTPGHAVRTPPLGNAPRLRFPGPRGSLGARPGLWSDPTEAAGINGDFRYGPTSPLPRGVERDDHPATQLVHPFRQVEGSHARDAWTVRGLALEEIGQADASV